MGMKDNFKQAAKELLEPGAAEQTAELETQDTAAQTQPATAPAPAVSHAQTSIIAAGTVITGSIQSEGNLELQGEVKGNIDCKGDLALRGKLTGDATSANVSLNSIQVKGNLVATGLVEIDENSVVNGDIQADSLVLNGKVNGNTTLTNRLSLGSSGTITGDVTAKKLVVAEGGTIDGAVRIGKSEKKQTYVAN